MKLRPYPEYTDSGVPWLGEIPAHWSTIRTKYLLREIDDRTPTGTETLLSMRQIRGLVPHHEVSNKPANPSSLIGYKRTHPNDIVINRMRASIGLIARTPEFGLVSPDYAVFRPTKDINTDYFTLLFKTSVMGAVFRIESKGLGTGTSGFLRLYSERFGAISVPLAPRGEQDKILAFVQLQDFKIRRFIRNKRSLIKLLNEQKQVIINQAVTRGINRNALLKSSSISYLGDVPSHWKFLPFSRLSRVNRGASPRPSGDPRFFYGNYIPWLTVGEVTKDESIYLDNTDTCLTELGCKLSRVFKKGTLVITNSGATLGVPKILNIDVCANDGIVAFNQLSSSVNSIFAYYFLKSNTQRLREELRQGGTQPNLNTELIKSIVCPIPPVEEQIQIVDFINAQLSDIEKVI